MLWLCPVILALIMEVMVVVLVIYCCLTNEHKFSSLQDWLSYLVRQKQKYGLDWFLI